MYQIIQTIKEFVGGTMYKGLDELGHPGFASTDVELIPESYECLFKSYEDVQNAVEKYL